MNRLAKPACGQDHNPKQTNPPLPQPATKPKSGQSTPKNRLCEQDAHAPNPRRRNGDICQPPDAIETGNAKAKKTTAGELRQRANLPKTSGGRNGGQRTPAQEPESHHRNGGQRPMRAKSARNYLCFQRARQKTRGLCSYIKCVNHQSLYDYAVNLLSYHLQPAMCLVAYVVSSVCAYPLPPVPVAKARCLICNHSGLPRYRFRAMQRVCAASLVYSRAHNPQKLCA